jgi:methyl-accepting chemotaxis protein
LLDKAYGLLDKVSLSSKGDLTLSYQSSDSTPIDQISNGLSGFFGNLNGEMKKISSTANSLGEVSNKLKNVSHTMSESSITNSELIRQTSSNANEVKNNLGQFANRLGEFIASIKEIDNVAARSSQLTRVTTEKSQTSVDNM